MGGREEGGWAGFGSVTGGLRGEGWGEGEEFGAEGRLEGGAAGELVEEVGQGDARGFVAGDQMV